VIYKYVSLFCASSNHDLVVLKPVYYLVGECVRSMYLGDLVLSLTSFCFKTFKKRMTVRFISSHVLEH